MRSTEALPRFPLMDGTANNLASVFNHCRYSHFFFQLCQNNEDEMLESFFFPLPLNDACRCVFSLCNPQLWDVKRIIARLKKQKDAKQIRHLQVFFKLSSEFLFSSPGCLRKQATSIITSKLDSLPQTWTKIRLGEKKDSLVRLIILQVSVRNKWGVVELQVHKWQHHVSQTDRCTDRQILAFCFFFNVFLLYFLSHKCSVPGKLFKNKTALGHAVNVKAAW